MSDPLAAAVVLAAGEGTRMRSATPKVLHTVGGRSLLGHILRAVDPLRPGRTLVVVGKGRDRVAEHLAEIAPAATAVVQEEQNGTGHAVRVALETEPSLTGTVLVVPGDAPLLSPESLTRLVEQHTAERNAATLLTALMPDPRGYGRVVRGHGGLVKGIVEERDADDEQRRIREVGTSVYAFEIDALRESLAEVRADNAQGEEYLTDVIGILVGKGRSVGAVTVTDHREAAGVNDRAQLAAAGAAIRDRVNTAHMMAGVTIVDPTTTYIDDTVAIEPDAVIEPFTTLSGATEVAAGAVVGPHTELTDTVVGPAAHVTRTVAIGAVIGASAEVGPYTYLRPGTELGRGAKAGAYVEMKKAVVGDGSKVPHLSYVGDATIGERSNIGAACVFVNYDGVAKHHTVVGDDVRIGSDNMLVAPVRVGDGAYTAAGSVITDDVPPGAMAVARARQRVIEGWVERRRAGTASAAAARRALDAARAGAEPGGTTAAASEDNGDAAEPRPGSAARG